MGPGPLRCAVVAIATTLFTFLGGAPAGHATGTDVPPPAAYPADLPAGR